MIRRPRVCITEALASSVAYTSSGGPAPVPRASSSIMAIRRGWSAAVSRTPCGSNLWRLGKIANRIETPRKSPVSVTHRLLLPPITHGRIAAASSAAAMPSASV
jgi:hypothetical protein